MKRVTALLIAIVTALPMAARAGGIRFLGDRHDSMLSVRVAQMDPDVESQVKVLNDRLASLVPNTLGDVERALGRPAGSEPDSTFALPICQKRTVEVGGRRVEPSKRHHEFYPVDGLGGLQVWYEHDSTTVGATVAYLKVDSQFLPCTRATQNQLGTRLLWDQERLALLEQSLRRKFGK